MSEFDNVVKRRINSLYGCFGDLHRRYAFRGGFRGYGRLYAAAQCVGYGELLGKLIRIRLRYPLWYEGDDLIRLLRFRLGYILHSRGGGSNFYIDTDSVQ